MVLTCNLQQMSPLSFFRFRCVCVFADESEKIVCLCPLFVCHAVGVVTWKSLRILCFLTNRHKAERGFLFYPSSHVICSYFVLILATSFFFFFSPFWFRGKCWQFQEQSTFECEWTDSHNLTHSQVKLPLVLNALVLFTLHIGQGVKTRKKGFSRPLGAWTSILSNGIDRIIPSAYFSSSCCCLNVQSALCYYCIALHLQGVWLC